MRTSIKRRSKARRRSTTPPARVAPNSVAIWSKRPKPTSTALLTVRVCCSMLGFARAERCERDIALNAIGGWTPLQGAVYYTRVETMQYLISAGANVNLHNDKLMKVTACAVTEEIRFVFFTVAMHRATQRCTLPLAAKRQWRAQSMRCWPARR